VEVVAEPTNVLPDPGSLAQFQNQLGSTLAFRVTGRLGGAVYGTDIYTSDTTLATAAVHAGVLRVGQTGVVRVKILGQQPFFTGTMKNGVSSASYGGFPGYQVLRNRAN
jgi:hypothetical protein